MKNQIRVKVRGFRLDVYGHVNNARYLEFLEDARWTLIESEIDLEKWRQLGFGFTIVKITINYRKAARLNDVLEIRTRLEKLGGKSGVFKQEITLASTGEPVADAEVVLDGVYNVSISFSLEALSRDGCSGFICSSASGGEEAATLFGFNDVTDQAVDNYSTWGRSQTPDGYNSTWTLNVLNVPEPVTAGFLALGLTGLAAIGRRHSA